MRNLLTVLLMFCALLVLQTSVDANGGVQLQQRTIVHQRNRTVVHQHVHQGLRLAHHVVNNFRVGAGYYAPPVALYAPSVALQGYSAGGCDQPAEPLALPRRLPLQAAPSDCGCQSNAQLQLLPRTVGNYGSGGCGANSLGLYGSRSLNRLDIDGYGANRLLFRGGYGGYGGYQGLGPVLIDNRGFFGQFAGAALGAALFRGGFHNGFHNGHGHH